MRHDGCDVDALGYSVVGIPRGSDGKINKSDLNLSTSRDVSNRLIVPADVDGDICIFSLVDTHIVVDVFGATDDITIFPNQRTDTRDAGVPVPGGSTLTVNVPDATGGKTVVGQLTATQSSGGGFLTAFACDDGIPRGSDGKINKSDLNLSTSRDISNRLIVPADVDGDICIFSWVDTHIVVDVFGVTDDITIFPNQRTDTRG